MINAVNVQSLVTRLSQRIVHLPRVVRIALVVLFSASLTLLVTPLAYNLLQVDFFAASSNEILPPTIVAMVCGLLFYVLGWRLLIGFAGETPASNSALVVYFGVGLAVCVLALTLVIIGAVSGTGA